MTIEKRNGDLFSCYDAHALMQCVSADFVCGAGIALQFNKHFNTKKQLRKTINGLKWWDSASHGFAVITKPGDDLIPTINLVTKRRYFEKPTVDTLKLALIGAKEIAIAEKINVIAMPRIAAGLDKLDFQTQVIPTLEEVFNNSDIHFIIYTM